jgi:tetratricopeptide (TPR) repeat protein
MRAGFVLLSLLVLFPGIVRADNTAVAREHYKKGTVLYDMGNYAEAAEEYRLAFQAKDDVAILYNIGQANRLAGKLEDALAAYKGYLRRVPQAKNRAEVEARMAELQAAIDQRRVEEEQRAKARAEEEERRRVEQERAAAEAARREAQPAAAITQPAPARQPVYKKWWLWTAVGAGVVAVGLGVGLGVGLTRDRFDPSLGRIGPAALAVEGAR